MNGGWNRRASAENLQHNVLATHFRRHSFERTVSIVLESIHHRYIMSLFHAEL